MIGTAVDTNVVSELLLGGPSASFAAAALTDALVRGPLIVGAVVYAELQAAAPQPDELDSLLAALSIEADFDLPADGVRAAASAWRAYLARRRGAGGTYHCSACGLVNAGFRCAHCGTPIGGPRHILADFLVGAHALYRASALLTWDRGVYATYFPDLQVLRPGGVPGG